MSTIANTCVLHPAGAKALARAGGGLAVAKALKEGTGIPNDRLFLLARTGFLATLGLPEIVGPLVDKEDLVENLVLVSPEMGWDKLMVVFGIYSCHTRVIQCHHRPLKAHE